jgi:hypothetical protein
VCLACFGLAVGVLAIDELVCPRAHLSKLYTSARSAALLTALVSIMLVATDLFNTTLVSFVDTLDLYALVFGLCLPFIAQFLMIAVRDSRHYSLGSILEVCEFGLPFAVFLSVFHLSVAYWQRFQLGGQPNGTQPVFRTDPPFVLFYSLAPVFVGPSVVAYITCAIEGCAIDTLISVGLALCVHYLASSQASTLGIYGTLCGGLAFGVRLLAEYDPPVAGYPGMDSQLPPSVLRQRSRDGSVSPDTEVAWQRNREAQELTSVLEEPITETA